MFKRGQNTVPFLSSRSHSWHARFPTQFGENVVAHIAQTTSDPARLPSHVGIPSVHLSNTYLFYQRGWSGITVEPTPGIAEEFHAIRPRDEHLCCAVIPTSNSTTIPFFCFAQPSPYNTASEAQARAHAARTGCIYETLQLPCMTLGQILDTHLPTERQLDLLCTDCEGMDAAILTGFDWQRFVPKVVIFEDEPGTAATPKSPLVRLLSNEGYELFARVGPSTIMYRPI